jgi:hypothetical protein
MHVTIMENIAFIHRYTSNPAFQGTVCKLRLHPAPELRRSASSCVRVVAYCHVLDFASLAVAPSIASEVVAAPDAPVVVRLADVPLRFRQAEPPQVCNHRLLSGVHLRPANVI